MSKQALPGSRLNAFLMDPDDLVIVGLDTPDGPEHPRYDERVHLPVDEALVNSLKFRGNKVAVLVCKITDSAGNTRAEVVDGRQRVRCGRVANKQLTAEGKTPIRLKVMVERGSDKDLFGVLILTNELRQNDGPLQKAEKLQRCLEMGYTEAEAAVTFGVSEQTIRDWLILLELDPAVRNAVEARTLSATAAVKLGKLDKKRQRDELAALLQRGPVTAKAAGHAVKASNAKANGTAAPNPAPSKRVLRKLVEANKAAASPALSGDFIRGLRFALGDLPPGSVAGLTPMLKGLSRGK
jgi:ParB family chromosome partitioning protein